MPERTLRASEAARSLGISTKDLVRLVHQRKIRYQMINGIAHFPRRFIDEYRRGAS